MHMRACADGINTWSDLRSVSEKRQNWREIDRRGRRELEVETSGA
jgi:hypothetical protein